MGTTTTVAGATTLFNATIGEIASTKHGISFITNLHDECINIAKSEKIQVRDDDLAQQRRFLSDKNLHGTLLCEETW